MPSGARRGLCVISPALVTLTVVSSGVEAAEGSGLLSASARWSTTLPSTPSSSTVCPL